MAPFVSSESTLRLFSLFRKLRCCGEGGGAAILQIGFNTEFRYAGLRLHLQTEDRGDAFLEVVSHLFQAGTVLLSRSSQYSGTAQPEQVKRQMQEQHQELLRALLRGEFDAQLRERLPRNQKNAKLQDVDVS